MTFLIMSVIDNKNKAKCAIGIEQLNNHGEIVRVFSLYCERSECEKVIKEIIDTYVVGADVTVFTYSIYKILEYRKDIKLTYRKVQRYKNSLWQLTLDATRRKEDCIALV